MLGRKLTAQFALGKLVHIETHHVHAGRGTFSIEQIIGDKIFENHLCMAAVSEGCDDRTNLEAPLTGGRQGSGQAQEQYRSAGNFGGAAEELATVDVLLDAHLDFKQKETKRTENR